MCHLQKKVIFLVLWCLNYNVLEDAKVAKALPDKFVNLRDKLLALETCFDIVLCVIISPQWLGSWSFYYKLCVIDQ